MGYTVSITSSGQMTLPKALREKYGIFSKVFVDEDKETGKIVIEREKTREEQLKDALTYIDSIWTDDERERIQANAGLTYKKAIEDLEKSPEGRREIEAEYGKGIYA